ncbi:MAG: LysR family transcriptional regulator [Paracoccus sp. (in: a-proteobacteria)]|nr:LysR family transcriptional regulator [Paracoccus sp. (in: a-proteobacteria)]
MIDKLEMFIALARERHFGRAAELCGVTQPSLSSAIRALEDYYGVPLVRRGSRFQGLTPEGARLLDSARLIVAEARAIRSTIQQAQREPEGVLRLGVIPSALTALGLLTRPFMTRCPRMGLNIRPMTSLAIAEAMADFRIDAGISYAADDTGRLPGPGFEALPLYRESWAVLMPAAGAPDRVGWDDLPGLRLCLMTGDMQNRRILDQRLALRGLDIVPVIEAASILGLVAQVQSGPALAAVLPRRAAQFFARTPGLACLPLPEDDAFSAPEVALIVPAEGRRSPALSEFLRGWPLIDSANHPTESAI